MFDFLINIEISVVGHFESKKAAGVLIDNNYLGIFINTPAIRFSNL